MNYGFDRIPHFGRYMAASRIIDGIEFGQSSMYTCHSPVRDNAIVFLTYIVLGSIELFQCFVVSSFSEPLIVVGVVDMRFYSTGSPAECRLALRAPHLVASVDLEYAFAAFGARLRVCSQESGRCHIVRITRVFCVALCALDDMTIRTRPLLANTTLPLCAKESAAIFGGTCADKLSHLSRFFPGWTCMESAPQFLFLSIELPDLFIDDLLFLAEFFHADSFFHNMLCFRH